MLYNSSSHLALYEISMSIGNSLDMHKMLNESITTILSRLNCSSAGIYKFEEESYKLLYAKPKVLVKNNNYLKIIHNLKDELIKSEKNILVESINNIYYYLFELKNFGFLVLVKKDTPFEDIIIKSLPKINIKLLNAINACSNHTYIEEAMKQAEAANEFKSQFLANMSHEIRTPMNGILGFVEQLAKNEKDPERVKKFNIVKNSGGQLLAIINDILDFSKIESGKLDIESHPYNLKELLESSLDMFSQIASEKDIRFTYSIESNLPEFILGDEVRLKQVIFNLLSNAIKFTPNKGNVSLFGSFDMRNDNVIISVKDTGIGISEEKLESIFESFIQEDDSVTRKYGGTGLGLSISSRLVSLMGGDLKVQSESGVGSEFYFNLPIKLSNEIIETQKLPADNAREPEVFDAHILVVEDNRTNQMLMSMILEDLGVTYDIANNGVEAVSHFKEKKYDFVLMDENMPIMNGVEATKIIRDKEKSNLLAPTPIIAVTANALTTDRKRFLDAGMDDYVSKPYSEDDIVKILQKYK